MDSKYVKFMVLYNKPGNPPNAIPWTGIDPTLEFVKEKLEDGYIVQVKPFTRDEWKSTYDHIQLLNRSDEGIRNS